MNDLLDELLTSASKVLFDGPDALDALTAIALLGEHVTVIAPASDMRGRDLLIHTNSGMCFAGAEQTVVWMNKLVGSGNASRIRERIRPHAQTPEVGGVHNHSPGARYGRTLVSRSGAVVIGVEWRAATYLIEHVDFEHLLEQYGDRLKR